MTREEKDLLLKDLCARLPYGVKFATKYSHFNDTHELLVINKHSTIVETFKMLWWDIEDVKPYLRPLSSMTDEEKEELLAKLPTKWNIEIDKFEDFYFDICEECAPDIELFTDIIDWLNKKMFDFRGLIPKDLALSTEKYNPYKD